MSGTEQNEWLAEQFEASRPHLQAVAFRMLSSHAEADEAVQETWLRLARADRSEVENMRGWLTTVTARVCLDKLRARRSRPEDPAGADIPEPLVQPRSSDFEPEREAVMADSIGAALLVVLDLLSPAERVAFVLHDVFAVPFDEVAETIGKTSDAARQLASRARRRVQGTPTTAGVDLVRQREVVSAFLNAARNGDFEGLLSLLDPDVVLRPDAAAVSMGSLRETRGAAEVARTLARGGARGARLALVDSVAGFVWAPGAGDIRGVVEFTVVDGKIVALDVTGDHERIDEFDIVLLEH